MDRLLGLCIAASAAGLVLLGLLAHAARPPTLPLEAVPSREGQRVCVEAAVATLDAAGGEASRFRLAEGNRTLAGRAWFVISASPGDRVRACGRVEPTPAGDGALVLERPADVRILRAWDADAVPLAVLSREPWDHADRSLAVWGRLERSGPRSYLVDPATDARMRAAAPDDAPRGLWLRWTGLVEYDRDESLFRIRLDPPAFDPGRTA